MSALPNPDAAASLKEQVAGLSVAQRALLARRLGKAIPASGSGRHQSEPLPRAEPVRVENDPAISLYPASPGQHRMWFLHHYAPESPVYCVPSAFHLAGPLDVVRLEHAFQTVIQLHEMLRTTFVMEAGALLQRVAPRSAFALPQISLEHRFPAERRTAAETTLREEAARPFDLSAAPPFRAVLLRLHADEHVVLLVLHHIISDGWSRANFYREIAEAYADPAANPPLSVQFADYSAWQNQLLANGALDSQLAYWKSKLAAESPPLELPADRLRPPLESFRGGRAIHPISPALFAKLKVLAQEEGATVFMVFLAAFKVLLHRYTGNNDVVVGVPIANRQRVEVEKLIGFFANTLVMRTALAPELTFRELLRRVRDTAVEAYANQDMPFDRLVELLQVRRDASRTPLFQTTFAMQDFPAVALPLPGIQSTPWYISTHTSKFDFSLTLERHEAGWRAATEYSTDLFDPERIERMLGHWNTILESIADEPGQKLFAIPLLTIAERQQLQAWNRTARPYRLEKCVHQLVEEQAGRTPEAIAVSFGDQTMSYRELDSRSSALATCLRSMGVGPDVLVGLCTGRSPDMLVGMLGILKAGGAYVPLDPEYPKERIDFILRDSAAPVLVTQRSLAIEGDGARHLYLDEPIPLHAETPPAESSPSHLAYVIYTSGSTGTPKGVAIEHRNATAFLHWVREAFSNAELAGVLASTSICFDLSVFEIFGPLSWGGHVVLANSALDLWTSNASKNVSLVNTVPSVLAELLQGKGLPASVHTINLAGEPLRQALVEDVFRKTSIKRVNDLYGPSETTTYSTWAQRPAGGSENVGGPIANTQIYLLNAHGQPVPVGIPAEIYIGGAGVARGYWKRPELTAEKFVPDRFGELPGGRLFRTGDLARWRGDGTIVLQGRIDSQVKLRGFRIELGEIENALRSCAGIRDAVVTLRNDEPAGPRLVAHLVASNCEPPVGAALRAQLAKTLPEYMLPAAFIWLDELPLTPNGKVDRKALPLPEAKAAATAPADHQPTNVTELELMRIWRRLFQREQISRNDHFFELGGHSLLATRLTAEVNDRLGCQLPISALFQSPTVELLAQRINDGDWAPPFSSLVPLQPEGNRPPFFLVHGWGGDVFVFSELARQLGAGQPVHGLQAVGLDGKSPRHCRIEEMAAHYLKEIRRLQPGGPYYFGGYSMGGLIAFEMAQQVQRSGGRVALLALFDTVPICTMPWPVFGRAMSSYLGHRCAVHFRRWRDMPHNERFQYLRERWQALSYWLNRNRPKPPVGTLPEKEAPDPGDPMNDHYYLVAKSYRLVRYPGAAQLFVSEDAKPHWVSAWQGLARGGVTCHHVTGKHMELLTANCLPAFANTLNRVLQETQAKEHLGATN